MLDVEEMISCQLGQPVESVVKVHKGELNAEMPIEQPPDVPAKISFQLRNRLIQEGDGVKFSALISGKPPPKVFQLWKSISKENLYLLIILLSNLISSLQKIYESNFAMRMSYAQ